VVVEGYFIDKYPNLENEFLERGHTNVLSINMENSKNGPRKALIGSDEYDVTNGAYADVHQIVENMGRK
jgi:hypothetical protein